MIAAKMLQATRVTRTGRLVAAGFASQMTLIPFDGARHFILWPLNDSVLYHSRSQSQPDAKVYRKSGNAESKLSCLGHTLGAMLRGLTTRE
jgi:hypothetical protein